MTEFVHWCSCAESCVRRIHREGLCPTCYECRNVRDAADEKAAAAVRPA